MRRIFIAGLFLLLLGAVIFSFLAFNPKGLRTTNLSDQSATISWLTAGSGRAKVFVSESNWKVAIPVLRIFLSESFQEDQAGRIHYLVVKNLLPEKKYYFSVSWSVTSDSFVTKPILEGIGLPTPTYGKVIANDGKTAGKRTILYFNDSFSTITNETGGWSFDLSRLSVFPPLVIEAVSEKYGVTKMITGKDLQPVPTIYLK